jgi:hypothetical protein
VVNQSNPDEVKTHMMYNQPIGAFKKLKQSTTQALRLSRLRFILPDGTNLEVPVSSFLLLGRQDGNEDKIDVDLSAFGSGSGVSRTHAAIQITHSAIFVRDFESRNGVFVNGEELFPMRDYPLQDGDELKLGNLKLRVIFVP